MVVRVVRMRRPERLGWRERSDIPMIVKALRVTGRHFVRNLYGFAAHWHRSSEARVDYPNAPLAKLVLGALLADRIPTFGLVNRVGGECHR